jgi:hypothetical protein
MKNFYLIYVKNGERLENELFSNLEDAQKRATQLSINAHDDYPDVVDEDGSIFIMDWEGYSKPYYTNNSHFAQFIQVREEEE